jgi:hypothetical protein
MIIFGVCSLTLASMISKSRLENNVRISFNILYEEGEFPVQKGAYRFRLDNFTDTIMVDTAYSIDHLHPVESALLMRRGYRINPYLENNPEGANAFPIRDLYNNITNNNTYYFTYARYWHGYNIFLRPLLALTHYNTIRLILCAVITVLSLFLLFVTYKKTNSYITIATLFFLISANVWAIGASMQYSSVFIIMLCASIYLLLFDKRIKDIGLFFFIVGMLTSFFDLLTAPIITLGIPLVFYIILNPKEKKLVRNIINIMMIWGIGYLCMWGSKWIITDLCYHTNIIKEAFGQVFRYTVSHEEFHENIFHINLLNMSHLLIYFIIAVGIWALTWLLRRNKQMTKQQFWSMSIVAIVPFLWTCLTKNHCFAHARYTFRNYLILLLVIAVSSMYRIKGFIEKRKKGDIKNEVSK